MKNYTVTLILILFSIMAFTLPAFTEVTGNFGMSFNQVVNDLGGGVILDIETPLYDSTQVEHKHPPLLDKVNLEIESQLNVGDIYRGKLTAAVLFDLGNLGVKLASHTVGKGYELKSIGHSQVFSAAFHVPIQQFGVDIGVGGKNAAPWGNPNLLNDAIPLGYDAGELEAIGAADITPAPRGLPGRDVTALLLLAVGAFEFEWIEGDVRLQAELTGDDKGHQAILHLQTAKSLENMQFTIAYEHGLLLWKGDLHGESAITLGINVPY